MRHPDGLDRYLRLNDRLEISRTGGHGWRIYVDGQLVESEGDYEHKEDAAMAGAFYVLSV
jgi:hypothetical protein